MKGVQKLPIQWISDNLKEDMVEERQQELERFMENLPNSITNVHGELSLKRLMTIFGSNLGVHETVALKANRTMIRTPRQIKF